MILVRFSMSNFSSRQSDFPHKLSIKRSEGIFFGSYKMITLSVKTHANLPDQWRIQHFPDGASPWIWGENLSFGKIFVENFMQMREIGLGWCKVYSYRLHTQDLVIPWGSYVCYTTNTLDTLEAFIAETYVQLVTTKTMCNSTRRSTLLESVLANAPTLYCAVSYITACVDISRMVFRDRSVLRLLGKSFDTCSKAAEQFLMDTQVISSWLTLLSVGKLGSTENCGGKLIFTLLGMWWGYPT